MTEKRQLPEQLASHTYKRPAVNEQYPAGSTHLAKKQVAPRDGREASERSQNAVPERQPAPVMAERSLQRVVTIPRADPSTAWNDFAQRQQQLRRARAKPQKYIEPIPRVPRTFTQTGARATSGRIKAVRPLRPHHNSHNSHNSASPIPARRRRHTARRGLLWKILSFFAIVAVLIMGANFVFGSNAFRIEQVNVVGTHNPALIQGIQRMGMQGQNIFLLDVTSLTARVEAYPLVASATLSKQWPNQITMSVIERAPVLLWQTGQGAQGAYSVDSQGVIIAPASETAGVDHLPLVVDNLHRGGKAQIFHPGSHLDPADVQFAHEVFTRLPQFTGVTTFKLLYASATHPTSTAVQTAMGAQSSAGVGSYILESSTGWIAYLGGAHDINPLDNRLTALQQVLSLAQKQQLNLATIDVRYGLRPVYTLKNQGDAR